MTKGKRGKMSENNYNEVFFMNVDDIDEEYYEKVEEVTTRFEIGDEIKFIRYDDKGQEKHYALCKVVEKPKDSAQHVITIGLAFNHYQTYVSIKILETINNEG